MRNSGSLKWLAFVMAVMPAVLFAYLGHFSRMTSDDFMNISYALELGPWQNVLYWRSVWTGHYSGSFLIGLVAPLEAALPAVLPIVTVVIWTLGMTWLLLEVALLLTGGVRNVPLCFSVAALAVAASISAFYTPQSFHWFIASLAYTFPVAVFTVNLALMLVAIRRTRSGARLALSALVVALISFICAGFSEMYLVFQLALLSLLLVTVVAFTSSALRRRVLIVFGGGWLGTLASLAVQWTSPGRLLRADATWMHPQYHPLRHLPDLVNLGIRDLYHMVVNPDTLLSFWLLFAVGLLVSFGFKASLPPAMITGWRGLGKNIAPYYVGLFVQIIFVAILWSHTSDDARFFGRFSLSFISVVFLNGALLVMYSLVIWRFGQLRAYLRSGPKRLPVYILVITLAGLALLFSPGLRAIHYHALNHLFVSGLCFLFVAWWEWTSAIANPTEKQLSLYAIAGTLVALLSVTALITVPRYFVGVGGPRHWSAAAFVLVTLGLIWGSVFGQCARRLGSVAKARLLRASAATLCLTFSIIVVSQIRLIPNFATFASEWDKRHALLLDLKASGQAHVKIPPQAFDLNRFLLHGEIVADQFHFEFDDTRSAEPLWNSLLNYYGFESITLIDGA